MGEIFALLSAFSWGLANIFIRRGQARDESDDGLFLSILINAVFFLVLALFLGLTGRLPPLNGSGVAVFILAGVMTTFLGRFFNYASIRRIGPARAASFKVTSPFFTLAIAYLFLNERLQLDQMLGAFVVMFGIWLLIKDVESSKRPADPLPQTEPDGPPAPISRAGSRQGGIHPGVLFGLLAAASFGSGHVVRKWGLELLPSPYLGALIGSWVALVSLIATETSKKTLSVLFRSNLAHFKPDYLIAGTMTSFAQLFLFLAFAKTSVSVGSVLSATEPIMTLGMASLLLRKTPERITWSLFISCLLVVAGVVFIVL